MMGRLLGAPLVAKLAGANLLVVVVALAGVALKARFGSSTGLLPLLAIALGVSLLVNVLLMYLALRPLADLESTAARLAGGDMSARVPANRLADRHMARVGSTLNALLDSLAEDRRRARRLASQVINAQDEERARLARELHDSTAQILTAVMLQLGAAARDHETIPLTERFATLRELVAEALEEVRSMSHTMHPRVLDDLGLAAALEWLARQTRIQSELDVRVDAEELDPPVEPHAAAALYRVAQEALRNAVRHADAQHITVRLRGDARSAVLEVADDGCGFDVRDAEERRPGMGLFSMRERVGLVDGSWTIASEPGHGTRVVASVPRAAI